MRWLPPAEFWRSPKPPMGARLYWNGDVRRFRPPSVKEVDATGAGDIFAAAFFTRLYITRDPWEAARFATPLSAFR